MDLTITNIICGALQRPAHKEGFAMKKRIPPKFRVESKIKTSRSLQERVRLLMERIHAGIRLWPYNDAACVKECIKRGLIKRGRRQLSARWAT